MTLSQLENEIPTSVTTLDCHHLINEKMNSALAIFDRIIRKYSFFHFSYLILTFSEFALFFYFFALLSQSALISIALSTIFLTLFSYFIFRVYWQTTKSQQLIELKNLFITDVKSVLDYQEEIPECHIGMANALCKLSESLIGREYSFYLPPKWLSITSSFLEKLSCWAHWKDCHQLKEIALVAAVEQQIKHVKCEPTNPDTHTSLANTYIILTGLYALSHSHEEDDGFWGPSREDRKQMHQKFRIASERAIEELKILSNFAPNDPWIHEQLAYSYRDLQMPAEEISEYELILRLMPSNTEIMYKLGVLYFEQGHNALGLHLYEQLRHAHYKKALALIRHYGAYSSI